MDESLSKGDQGNCPLSLRSSRRSRVRGLVGERPVKLTHAAVYLVDMLKFLTLSAIMLYAYPKHIDCRQPIVFTLCVFETLYSATASLNYSYGRKLIEK